ncbi:MAG: peptidylprolyl isomerase [Candidatus Firestonebacteria bacterium]
MVMDIFRNKKNMKTIYFAIAIAFVLSLGYAGITSNLFKPDPDTIAVVNGKAIKYDEFSKVYTRTLEQYQTRFFKGEEVPEMYKKDIKKGALQNLINQRLLLDYVKRNGITTSETEVKERIRETYSVGGKYNPNYLKYVLKMNRITEEELISDFINNSNLIKVQQMIRDSSKVSSNELTEEFDNKYSRKRVRFIKIDAAAFAKQFKIPQDEVLKYYNEKKPEFSIPEQLRVQYILMNLAKEFDAAAKEKAVRIIKELKTGAAFDALAKEYSEDPGSKNNGGDLNFFKKGMMVPEFEKAAFSLNAGEHTKEPVKTQFGYHIIKVEEKKGEEVRARHILIKPSPDEKVNALAAEKLKTIKKDFTLGAKNGGFAIKEGSFSLSEYLNPKDIDPDEQEAVKIALAKLKPGETSEAVETKKGFYVFKLTGIMPGGFKPFETVKNQIEETIKKEKAAPLAEAEAENIYKSIKDGKTTFDKACAKYGIKDTGYFTLDEKSLKGVEDTADFLKSVKSLKVKGELGKIVKSISGMYVLELAELKEPDMKKLEKEKETLKTDILNKKQQFAFSNFMEDLRKKGSVKDYSEKFFTETAAE